MTVKLFKPIWLNFVEHDIKFYALTCVLALLSVASILTLNVSLIALTLAIAILLIAFYKLHYILESLIFKKTNLIQVLDGYELSGDRSAAIRRIEGNFSATAAALLLSGSEEAVDRNKVESIISNSHHAFKFVMQVERLDINKLLDRLQTKRGMREIELGRLDGSKGNAAKASFIKRQIEQIDHEIERISTGGAPLKVSQYIMTSALSENKFNAQERAKSQLRELAGEFGALMGAKSEQLIGNDLLEVLRFDSTMM